jgi:two-component system response regulator HydG
MPAKPIVETEPADEPLKVLVVDDEPAHAETVAEALEAVGYACKVATSGKAGALALDKDDYDVVLTDMKMGDFDGLALTRRVREVQPDAEVIVITGHGDVPTAVEAIKLGAAHYLLKPVDLGELRSIVGKASERLRLSRDVRELRRQLEERFGFEGVVGNSPKMQAVIAKLQAVAATSARVLIHGETGTGKELVAKAIHNNSPRKNKPFVAMNCTALNENLLDDELFGHEAGAFTGADKVRKGRFEHANGGTLFLDEIGDMPPMLQAKLLRVLENDEVFRIGANEPIKVNVRLISATHRDLDAEVKSGRFRQDLFHRIKVVAVTLPPLRERREDLPLLCKHFIDEFNRRHGKKVTGLSEAVRKAFNTYDWPGNVRELRNTIESMVVLDRDGLLDVDDLQDSPILAAVPSGGGTTAAGADGLVGRPMAEVERYYIEKTLERTAGNREEAAKLLGIGERTLYRNMQEWKFQDQVRAALSQHPSLAAAAASLALKPEALARKIKKWGWPAPE